jgi:hypothetical protein
MENKLFDFLKNKNITESSLKLYMNNLKRLNNGEPPKSFTFLKDVNKILESLEKYKPNTRRTYLISIVSLLKQDPKQKKLYDKYYEHLDKYNKEGQKNNEKSETQKKNWIEQNEVQEIYYKLSENVKPFLSLKKLSPSEYEAVLRWVVLSLYVLQKPRRNMDYQKCLIVNKVTDDLDKGFNYLDLPNSKWFFNNYKTKGTYKTQVIDVTPEMMEVITSYLKIHPLAKELKKKSGAIPFLVDANGEPFEATNAITRILNKIFGKRIGVSMLRNIYLTDKYSDQMKELQQDAHDLGTSSNVIQNQYTKIDDK